MIKAPSKQADEDPLHAQLKAVIEVKTHRYLWTPDDGIDFIPALASTIYGDGRALFGFTTIHDRPAFWVIRGDSSWNCGYAGAPDGASDFGDFTDQIITDLEDEFGTARCGYSGSSLREPLGERQCDCEDCQDDYVPEFPAIDDQDGCHWWRIKWPARFDAVPHPLDRCSNLLAEGVR